MILSRKREVEDVTSLDLREDTDVAINFRCERNAFAPVHCQGCGAVAVKRPCTFEDVENEIAAEPHIGLSTLHAERHTFKHIVRQGCTGGVDGDIHYGEEVLEDKLVAGLGGSFLHTAIFVVSGNIPAFHFLRGWQSAVEGSDRTTFVRRIVRVIGVLRSEVGGRGSEDSLRFFGIGLLRVLYLLAVLGCENSELIPGCPQQTHRPASAFWIPINACSGGRGLRGTCNDVIVVRLTFIQVAFAGTEYQPGTNGGG